MKITVIGAGNSGLAMAAHLGKYNNNVTLWNRSRSTISKLIKTRTISCEGVINDDVKIDQVTDNIGKALNDADVILVTTPANSHKELAEQIAIYIKNDCVIVLNPGRTFGALEFQEIFEQFNKKNKPTIAETQTIIYTCRKINEDTVNIIALKSEVLVSTLDANENQTVISKLPVCIQPFLIPAKSMIETSIGNVGMILHCAPLLLNTGWTENQSNIYKYYYDGITPTVGKFLERIDEEKVTVSQRLGLKVESTAEWLKRTYHVKGSNLYECIQNNQAYKTIDAPDSLNHRYIFEDVPYGLVPLELIGKKMGLEMKYTSLVIDLASSLTETDFRKIGRKLPSIFEEQNIDRRNIFRKRE